MLVLLYSAFLAEPALRRTVDHLDARVTQRQFLPTKGSVGFGLDFAVPPFATEEARRKPGSDG
jgi:hypothetical protein